MYYKQKLINDTITEYKKELADKDAEIKRLTEESFRVSKINHEFYHRQKSLELMVENAVKGRNIEAGEELGILDRINRVTEEHSDKMKNLKNSSKLPLTGVCEIDDLFKYFQNECVESGIQFKLNITENIFPLINNIIDKSKLETLIGDHIRDAIIAVNCAESKYKEIFVIFGIKNNCYELCIFDSGIEFEIDTLLKLGITPATTHKSTGGTGIGFITTFETLKQCNASLIITEMNKIDDKNYTKSVTIRFDKKHEYKVISYRANEIKKVNNRSELLIEKR